MSDTCILTFLGDIYLPKAYRSSIDLENYVVNLEYPITSHTIGVSGKINLKSSKNFLKETFKRNPLAVCLANNHILDYGDAGFDQTISVLAEDSIHSFGCGHITDNYNNPLYLELSGVSLALLGYACQSTSPPPDINLVGISTINKRRIFEDIASAKSHGANRIIVNLHWGAEEISVPKPSDVNLARSIIDAGADLIIGHHAHCIQSHEKYKGKYIFYGLGNCVFPDLNVACNFNTNTQLPEGQYIKKQKSWNKISLMVNYDVITESVQINKMCFDGRQLKYKRNILTSTSKVKLNVRNLSNIEFRYKLMYKLCILRLMLINYLSNPRMIKVKDIRLIFQNIS